MNNQQMAEQLQRDQILLISSSRQLLGDPTQQLLEKNAKLNKTMPKKTSTVSMIGSKENNSQQLERESFQDNVPTDPSVLLQIYNSNPVSDRPFSANMLNVQIKSIREGSIKSQEKQMVFDNKYEMLDEQQFSSNLNSQSRRNETLQTSQMKAVAKENFISNRNSKDLDLNSKSSVDLIIAKDATTSIGVEAIDDLADVFGSTQAGDINAASHHQLHQFRNTKMYDILRQSDFGTKKLRMPKGVKKPRVMTSQQPNRYRTTQQIGIKNAISSKDMFGSLAQINSKQSEPFYSDTFTTNQQRQFQQQPNYSEVINTQYCQATFSRKVSRKGFKKNARAVPRPGSKSNSRPHTSTHTRMPSRVLDLNQQIIQSDYSGVFQLHQDKDQKSRQNKHDNLIVVGSGTGESNQIKVKAELNKKKSASRRQINFTKIDRKNRLVSAQNIVQRPNLRTSGYGGIESNLTCSAMDLNSTPDASMKGTRPRIQSGSSYHTVGQSYSQIRLPRDLNRSAVNQVSQENSQFFDNQSAQSKEEVQISIPVQQPIPYFVIQSFQNSVKSKAQRQALQSSGNNPYTTTQNVKANKLNIEVKISDRVNSKKPGTALESKEGSIHWKSDESLLQAQEGALQVEAVTDQSKIDLQSPDMNRNASIGSSYKKGTDPRISTQKRMHTSLGDSDGANIEPFMEVFPTVLEENVRRDSVGTVGVFNIDMQTEIAVVEKQFSSDNEILEQEEISLVEDIQTKRQASREEIVPEQMNQSELTETAKPTEIMIKIAGTVLPPPPKQKMIPSVAKERKSIIQLNEKVRRNLQDTQVLVEKNLKNQSQSISVQNVSLIPRQKSGQSRQLTDSVSKNHILMNASIAQIQTNAGIFERKNKKSMSMTYLRRYKNRNVAKKRIEATQKFNREFNEPISIRATSALLMRERTLQATKLSQENTALKPDEKLSSLKSLDVIGNIESSMDFITEDSMLRLKQVQKLQSQEQDQEVYIKSVHSSQFQTTSRQDYQMVSLEQRNEDQKNDIKKGLKELTQANRQTKSIVHLQTNVQQMQIQEVKSLIKEPQIEEVPKDQALSRCSCDHEVSKASQIKSKHQEDETSHLKSKSKHTNSREFIMVDQVYNPYKMSENEMSRIKSKNRNLISQFQASSSALSNEQVHSSPDTVIQGKKGERRASLESAGTLYNKKSHLNAGTVNSSMQLAPNRESRQLAKDTSNQSPDNKAILQEDSPIINDDLKILLTNKKLQIKKIDSQNISQFSAEHDSPRLSPVNRPQASSRQNHREDLVETQKLSEHGLAGPTSLIRKQRPNSSFESPRDGSKQIKKDQHEGRRKVRAKAKTKGKTTRQPSARGSKASLGSGPVNLNKKDQDGQAIVSIDASRNRGRLSSSLDRISLVDRASGEPSLEPVEVRDVPRISQDSEVLEIYEDQLRHSGLGQDYTQSVQDEIGLSAEQVLALNQNQIGTLDFLQVCQAQQVLYGTLAQLQLLLNQAFSTHGAEQQATGATLTQGSTMTTLSPLATANRDGLKQRLVTTKYDSNKWDPNPTSTPFSREQQALRRKWVHEQRLLNGEVIKKPSDPQPIAREPRIKLVAKNEYADEKDRKQVELDNYYKFKRRQGRELRRKEVVEERRSVLNQCSTEELFLISKINALMQQQDLLVTKAQEITMRNFLTQDATVLRELRAQSQAIDQMKEQKASLERSFSIGNWIDSKHLPSARRLSSRRSFHKISQRGDASAARSLMQAAQSKLSSINHRASSRRERMSRATHQGRVTDQAFARSSGMSQNSRGPPVSTDPARLALSDAAVETRLSYLDYIHPIAMAGPAEQVRPRNGTGMKAILTNNVKMPKKHFGTFDNVQGNSLASTVNLYLNKLNYDQKVSVSPDPRSPPAKIVSPEVLQLATDMLYYDTENMYIQKDQVLTVGQTALTSQPRLVEKSIDIEEQESIESGPIHEEPTHVSPRLTKESGGLKTVETRHLNEQDGAGSTLLSADPSPIDKFNLVYRDKSSQSFKLMSKNRQHAAAAGASLKLRQVSSKSSLKGSSKTQRLKEALLSKSPSVGLASRRPSNSLNSDI